MRAARKTRISRSARRPSAPPRQGQPANPLDDEMHAYDTKDLERLFGLPASAVRALARAGEIQPVRGPGRLPYSVYDLVGPRPASPPRAAKTPPQRSNKTLQKLRPALPHGTAPQKNSL